MDFGKLKKKTKRIKKQKKQERRRCIKTYHSDIILRLSSYSTHCENSGYDFRGGKRREGDEESKPRLGRR
jgi:hypothetical protein